MSGVPHYAGSGFLLGGLLLAIEITAVALVVALVLGFGLATLRLSPVLPLRWAAWTYIWFVRGTPLLLQLVFLYNVLPSIHITLSSLNTALLGFSLNEAAFTAEIIRGGILSVSRNQTLAAQSIGLGSMQTMRFVVMPQAMRAILPALGNDAINLLKATSLASVIAVNELTARSEQIVAVNFEFFTVFSAAALLYLAVVSLMSLGQASLERRFMPERARSRGASWDRFLTFNLVFRGFRRDAGSSPDASDAQAYTQDAVPPSSDLREGDDRTAAVAAVVPEDRERLSTAGQPFVVFADVRKSYGHREVLKGIDLTVRGGTVTVIVGPSGAGKSTLLRLVNHLEELDAGHIRVDGRPVGYREVAGELKPLRHLARARAEARIGFVFQHFNLFEHLTALENVALAPRRVYGEPRKCSLARARQLLDAVGLADRHDHLPAHLSGGQQQRVAIARALAIRPRLMLFDEPTSALDPELVAGILGLMRGLAEAGITMIVVTHELAFAREIADHVIFIDRGSVIEEGDPEAVLGKPAEARTRAFIQLVERHHISTPKGGGDAAP